MGGYWNKCVAVAGRGGFSDQCKRFASDRRPHRGVSGRRALPATAMQKRWLADNQVMFPPDLTVGEALCLSYGKAGTKRIMRDGCAKYYGAWADKVREQVKRRLAPAPN